MHYKKTIALLVTLTIPLLFVNFTYIKVAGAHPGATGAPGDGSCADKGCHTGNVIQDDNTVNSLIFPTADSTYVPGQTYLITLKVKNPGIERFGFQIVSLWDSNNNNAGTLKVKETTRTQALTHKISGSSDTRYEITHKQSGTPAITTGNTEWTFNWTAPATAQGTITMYYATNSTNNDGQNSGDNIRLSKFKLKPATPSGIDEYMNQNDVTAFYNTQGGFLDLKYSLKKQCTVKISVMDGIGQQIYTTDNVEQKSPGTVSEKITLPAHTSSGIYFVNLRYENNSVTKKIFIQ
ncbi:MAG TPA: choice-of-anchor V domain-containing protein [Bacteroidia bacterium]|nr:choice-of-anchor V domain-containing protein [Bacteroidia bacterium]